MTGSICNRPETVQRGTGPGSDTCHWGLSPTLHALKGSRGNLVLRIIDPAAIWRVNEGNCAHFLYSFISSWGVCFHNNSDGGKRAWGQRLLRKYFQWPAISLSSKTGGLFVSHPPHGAPCGSLREEAGVAKVVPNGSILDLNQEKGPSRTSQTSYPATSRSQMWESGLKWSLRYTAILTSCSTRQSGHS